MRRSLGLSAAMMLALCVLLRAPASAGWTVTSLHPPDATRSYACGVSEGQQVGYAQVAGPYHASLWSGTAESWVDLNPAGADQSSAHGISGGQQAGFVKSSVASNPHASLWSGTAESWVDLHVFLPSGYSYSEARGIDVSGNDIWVVGWAYNSTLSRNEAVLWHYVIPEPSSLLALAFGLPGLAFALRRRSR